MFDKHDAYEISDRVVMVSVVTTLIGGLVGLIFTIYTNLSSQLKIEDVSTLKSDANVKKRGVAASVLNTLFATTSIFAINLVARPDMQTSVALMSMLWGNFMGFLWDNAVGSYDGWEHIKEGYMWEAWKNGLSHLYSAKFVRFFGTVLFDTFLTLIFVYHMTKGLEGVPFFRHSEATRTGVVNWFVGTVTFMVYANATRFNWAYPDEKVNTTSPDYRNWIPGNLMAICVAIAAALFLCANTGPEEGINKPEVKVLIVTFALAYVALLTGLNILDAKPHATVQADDANLLVDKPATLKVTNINSAASAGNTNVNAAIGGLILLSVAVASVIFTLRTSRLEKHKSILTSALGLAFVSMNIVFACPGLVHIGDLVGYAKSNSGSGS